MASHHHSIFQKSGLAAAIALLAAGMLTTAPAHAQDFVLKFGTQTINDIQHEYMKVYKTELEKATNGKIKVEVYPASQLGAIGAMLSGIRVGTIEGLVGPAELYVGIDTRYQALAMAGLFKSIDHARRVFDLPEARREIFAIGEQRGLVTIGLAPYDLQVFNTKQPVAKLADFSGKRIRVLASEAEQSEVKALGASTIPMALPETLPALQQGTIDGVTSVVGVFNAFRYYDTAPHILDSKLWALISTVQISKVWYDKLPPDLQKAVRDVGTSIEPQIHAWQTARIKSDRDNWTKNNGKFVSLSAPEQAEAEKRVADALQPMFAKDAALKGFYDKMKAIAAKVN